MKVRDESPAAALARGFAAQARAQTNAPGFKTLDAEAMGGPAHGNLVLAAGERRDLLLEVSLAVGPGLGRVLELLGREDDVAVGGVDAGHAHGHLGLHAAARGLGLGVALPRIWPPP